MNRNPSVKCTDVKRLNLVPWTDTSLIESMKKVTKEQPPRVKEESSPDAEEKDSQKEEAAAASGDQTPPLANKLSSSSSGSVATTAVVGDGHPTTQRMAAKVLDSGPRLTTAGREEL